MNGETNRLHNEYMALEARFDHLDGEYAFMTVARPHHRPQWVLMSDALDALRRHCTCTAGFVDASRLSEITTALRAHINDEAITGGLLNDLGKVQELDGQSLASDQVYSRSINGWLWSEWPSDPSQRGAYVLLRSEFDQFVAATFTGGRAPVGIIVLEPDEAPGVRFLALKAKEVRASNKRLYRKKDGPAFFAELSKKHPQQQWPENVGPAMVALIDP